MPATRPLGTFYHSKDMPSDFGYARVYWPLGPGERESMAPRILRKRRPAGAEATHDTAARVEVLLPPDAPQDYADPDFLVRHYESSLRADETVAFIQVTMRFEAAGNLHHPWEVARQWVRYFFIDTHAIPAMLILHAPHLANSTAAPHCHALLFPRRASKWGWLETIRDLGSDAAARKALLSWTQHRNLMMSV